MDLKIKNFVLEIWFLIIHLKSTEGCVRKLSEPAGSVLLSICLTVLKFGVPFIFQPGGHTGIC